MFRRRSYRPRRRIGGRTRYRRSFASRRRVRRPGRCGFRL